MENFNPLLNQITNLEAAQRQDKARLAEKDAKFNTLTQELGDVRKQLNQQTEDLRSQKEKSAQLEVANRNHEKVQKQLKSALKSAKDENVNLSKQLEISKGQIRDESMVYLENVQAMNANFRSLHEYLGKQATYQKLNAAEEKVKLLEAQLTECQNEAMESGDQSQNPNFDILKSENEDLQQRLSEAVEGNRKLQQHSNELEDYVRELDTKRQELKSYCEDLLCPYCGGKIPGIESETPLQIEGEEGDEPSDVNMDDPKEIAETESHA